MAVDERDAGRKVDREEGAAGVREPEGEPGAPGTGLLKGLAVTLRTMMHPAVTQIPPTRSRSTSAARAPFAAA